MEEKSLRNSQRFFSIEGLQVSHCEGLSHSVIMFFMTSVWVWSSCCLSSDFWKCHWWQLACCVVTAFSSITSSSSTLITTLPWLLEQMPCLLEVARCTLCVIFHLLFSLVLHSFMLPLFWHLPSAMSIDNGLNQLLAV